MSDISFKNFSNFANSINDGLYLSSGRFKFMNMKKKYKFISLDISRKLRLTKKCNLLDVGTGDGQILKQLQKKVKKAVGLDHYKTINILRKKIKKIKFISGDNTDKKIKIKGKFDKILLYSVIHYFKNSEQLFEVFNRLLKLLKPGGMILIGDIPNKDIKSKIIKSKVKEYKTAQRKWNEDISKITKKENSYLVSQKKDQSIIEINNKLFIKIFKFFEKKNCQVFFLDQNENLIFNFTRVDILIKKY